MDVTTWLFDADPAIRWQIMSDLTDAPDDAVAAERSRVATDEVHFDIDEGEGKPSRWNTLRAMRVLRWYHQAERLA